MSSITLKESRAKVITFGSSGRSILLRPRLQTVVSSAEAKEFKKEYSFLAADVNESTPEPVAIEIKPAKEKAKKKEKSEEDTKVSSSTDLGGDVSKKSAKRKSRKRKR